MRCVLDASLLETCKDHIKPSYLTGTPRYKKTRRKKSFTGSYYVAKVTRCIGSLHRQSILQTDLRHGIHTDVGSLRDVILWVVVRNYRGNIFKLVSIGCTTYVGDRRKAGMVSHSLVLFMEDEINNFYTPVFH